MEVAKGRSIRVYPPWTSDLPDSFRCLGRMAPSAGLGRCRHRFQMQVGRQSHEGWHDQFSSISSVISDASAFRTTAEAIGAPRKNFAGGLDSLFVSSSHSEEDASARWRHRADQTTSAHRLDFDDQAPDGGPDHPEASMHDLEVRQCRKTGNEACVAPLHDTWHPHARGLPLHRLCHRRYPMRRRFFISLRPRGLLVQHPWVGRRSRKPSTRVAASRSWVENGSLATPQCPPPPSPIHHPLTLRAREAYGTLCRQPGAGCPPTLYQNESPRGRARRQRRLMTWHRCNQERGTVRSLRTHSLQSHSEYHRLLMENRHGRT